MSATFETFMSDVEPNGITRDAELRAEWEKLNPGKPYPESNLVGEQVGLPEQSDAPKKDTPPKIDYAEKAAENRKLIEVALATP